MVKIPQLHLRTDRLIPQLGMGTYMIGGSKMRDPNNDTDGQISSIRYSIDKGITWIRTAQNYAEGYCEEIVGQAIKIIPREKLYISVAVNQNFVKNENDLFKEAQGSLYRLGVDYFDLYLLGGLDPKVPVSVIAKGLLQLKKSGITRDIGVANYRLEELKVIDELTKGNLVYNEVHFNLIVREPLINGVYEYCRDNNILLCAYRPLQLGQLAKPGITLLDDMAKKYNQKQATIALQWVLSHNNTAILVKAIDRHHIDDNVRLFDWSLSQDDFATLTEKFPIQMLLSDCTPPHNFFTL